MDKINFDTDNLIVLAYPPFAGGRFVSFCLSLSHHALPINDRYTSALLNNNDIVEEYKLRDQISMNMMPTKEFMVAWQRHELSEVKYDFVSSRSITGVPDNKELNDYISMVTNSGKKFFMVAHGLMPAITYCRNTWKNAQGLFLINYHKIQEISIDRKSKLSDSFQKSIGTSTILCVTNQSELTFRRISTC